MERVTSLVGLLPLLLLSGRAAAADAAPPGVATARLEVDASPDCATREELVERVASRSRRIRFQGDAAGDPALHATIGPGPGGKIVGELVVLRPGGKRAIRRLSASSCAEAIDGLALVIAIILDPAYAADVGASGAEAARAPGDEVAGPPPLPVGASPHAAPPPPPGGPVAAASAATAGGESTHWFGAGATAQAVWGVAPRLLPGLGFYASASLERASIWSPALLLWATHASLDDLVEPGGTAAFTLDAVSLDACPFRLRLAPLEARGCAAGLAGRLQARGSHTYSPTLQTRPFGTLGASALLTVTLGSIVELSGRFGGGASLPRDAFEFSPEVFHRVSSVTLVMSLGLGIRIP